MNVVRLPRRGSTLEQAFVGDAMHPGLLTCPTGMPLREVARMMASYRVHCVVVYDEAAPPGSIWGIVSDLDLAAAAASGDLGTRTAGTVAATPVVTVTLDTPLVQAAQLMAEYGNSHLVVLYPATAEPAGILSTLDLARIVANPQ